MDGQLKKHAHLANSQVKCRGMRIRLLAHAFCLLFFMGCTLPHIDYVIEDSAISFQRLFLIGYKLASLDEEENIEGFEMLPEGKELAKWYRIALNAIDAYQTLRSGQKSRNLITQEIISYYEAGCFPE